MKVGRSLFGKLPPYAGCIRPSNDEPPHIVWQKIQGLGGTGPPAGTPPQGA
jgi:hypothetical protein